MARPWATLLYPQTDTKPPLPWSLWSPVPWMPALHQQFDASLQMPHMHWTAIWANFMNIPDLQIAPVLYRPEHFAASATGNVANPTSVDILQGPGRVEIRTPT